MIFYGITARLSYQTMQIGFFRMAPRRSTLAGRDKASTTNKRNCKEFVIQHKFNTKATLCNLPYIRKNLETIMVSRFSLVENSGIEPLTS